MGLAAESSRIGNAGERQKQVAGLVPEHGQRGVLRREPHMPPRALASSG